MRVFAVAVLVALTTGIACRNDEPDAQRNDEPCGGSRHEWGVDCTEHPGCPDGCACMTSFTGSYCTPGCKSDDECPQNYICERANGAAPTCLNRCRENTDCDAGMFCGSRAFLGPLECLPGCRSDAECDSRSLCLGGTCVPPCHDSECPSGERCAPVASIGSTPLFGLIVHDCAVSCAQDPYICTCMSVEPGAPIYDYCPNWIVEPLPVADAAAPMDGGLDAAHD